jgi:hypothetical protein
MFQHLDIQLPEGVDSVDSREWTGIVLQERYTLPHDS